jgi:hypothetical protein
MEALARMLDGPQKTTPAPEPPDPDLPPDAGKAKKAAPKPRAPRAASSGVALQVVLEDGDWLVIRKAGRLSVLKPNGDEVQADQATGKAKALLARAA